MKLEDQALINHEMPGLGILVRNVIWPVNIWLNVTLFPTMLLSVCSIEWHGVCSVGNIESFFLVSDNMRPYYLLCAVHTVPS